MPSKIIQSPNLWKMDTRGGQSEKLLRLWWFFTLDLGQWFLNEWNVVDKKGNRNIYLHVNNKLRHQHTRAYHNSPITCARWSTPLGKHPLPFSKGSVGSFTNPFYLTMPTKEGWRRQGQGLLPLNLRQGLKWSYQSFKNPGCWSCWGLIPRPPTQQPDALPTEQTRRQ